MSHVLSFALPPRRTLAVLALALAAAILLLSAAPASGSWATGQVRGTVTDALSSLPVAGAIIRLEPRSFWGDELPWVVEVTSDGTGSFEASAIPATYGIRVSHGAYRTYVGTLFVGSGGATWANVSLDPAAARTATLRGYATETGTGSPVMVGRIVAEPSYAFTGSYVNASALNESGYYEMGLVPGMYDVLTRNATGYTPARFTYESIGTGVTWLNFTLDPNPVDAWVNGTVWSDSGSGPIPNATVSALVDGESFGPVLTDAAGAFGLNVPAGSVTIGADAPGHAFGYTSTTAWSGGTTYVSLTLAALSATIRGYATNATSGLPIAAAAVSASDFDLFYDRVLTDGSGYYEIHVVPDLLDLRATADGYGTTRTFGFLSEGQTFWWNVTLYPIIADIVGYAVDELTGDHLPNLNVLVGDGITGYFAMTTTDATGYYAVRLTAVPFVISTIAGTGVYAGGFAYGNAARGGTVWLNVTIHRVTASVRVTAVDGLSGLPVPGASVSLSWLGLYVDFNTTDANGSTVLDAPAARTVAIFGSAGGYDFAYAFVDLVPGLNNVTLVLYRDLPTDVVLKGYVTNETAAPIWSARVEVTGYSDQDATGYTDSTGYYEMRIVAAPQWVLATASGLTGNSTDVAPSPGSTVWANFTLRSDPDRPVIVSLVANPNTTVSPANPTDIVADVLEASPAWASGVLYRMVSRAGNLGTFVQLRSIRPEDFDIVGRGGDRYDVSVPWDARSTGGWIQDATQAEWWPMSTAIQAGSYAIMGSWTNGSATADPAIAGFDQFTGQLQFVFSAAYGIITPGMDPLSTFQPTGVTAKYDLTTGAQSYEPPVRGAAFRLGSLRLSYDDAVPPGTYAASVSVYDHAGRGTSDVTFFGVGPDLPFADAGTDVLVDEDLIVSLDGRASSDGGGIVNWTWTFADGGARTLYGPTPSYAFATPGAYVITLTVRDADGNTDADTVTVTVRDLTPPTASIASPAAGSVVSGAVEVLVDAADNAGVVRVELFVDNASVGNDTSGPYAFTLDTLTYARGNHTIRVVAYDAAGHTAEASRTVYVTAPGGGGDPAPLVLVGGIGILAAVVATVAAFLLLRRRRPPMAYGPQAAGPTGPVEAPSPEAAVEPTPETGASEETIEGLDDL